jgi:hypothetical protein
LHTIGEVNLVSFHLLQKLLLLGTLIFFPEILDYTTQTKMIMNMTAQTSSQAITIEPCYNDEGPLRKRFKKICSIQHQSKYSPIPSCPPSVVSDGLQDSAKNVQSSIPRTVIILVQNQRPKVKDCFEPERRSSSNVTIKRKQAASTTRPPNTLPLVKPLPLRAPPKIPCSPISSILPLGRPLAVVPCLPKLATGRAIPKLILM